MRWEKTLIVSEIAKSTAWYLQLFNDIPCSMNQDAGGSLSFLLGVGRFSWTTGCPPKPIMTPADQ